MTIATLARGTARYLCQLMVYIYLIHFNLVQSEELCRATPRTIMQSFINECTNTTSGAICTQAWNTFRNAVVGQPHGNIPPSNYQLLVETFPTAGINKTLIGLEENSRISAPGQVDAEVEEVLTEVKKQGTSFLSSSNSPLSRIGRAISGSSVNASWCSNTSLDDFIYEGTCPCNNSQNFWVELHTRLSSSARGTLIYVTDGEKPGGAYRSDSFFSQHVIPNLNRQTSPQVVVLVVHRTGVGESCSLMCGTLLTLQEDLQERSIQLTCYDINGQIRSINTRPQLATCLANVITDIQTGSPVSTNSVICRTIIPGVEYAPTASLSILAFSLAISGSI